MKTICLDPGHGGRDPGAVHGELKESAVTLEVALAVEELLKAKYRVKLTRTDDTALSLNARCAIADSAGADLFVSIHVNSAESARAEGYEVFVRPDPTPESLALASAMLVQFGRRWPDHRNRGLKQARFRVVLQQRPSCLVECFFISNPAEREMLNTAAVRGQMAEAIAWGCGNFIRSTSLPAEL